MIEVKTISDPDKSLVTLAKQALDQISKNEYAKRPIDEEAVAIVLGMHMKGMDVAFGNRRCSHRSPSREEREREGPPPLEDVLSGVAPNHGLKRRPL